MRSTVLNPLIKEPLVACYKFTREETTHKMNVNYDKCKLSCCIPKVRLWYENMGLWDVDEADNISSSAFDNLNDTLDRTSVPCPHLYYIISLWLLLPYNPSYICLYVPSYVSYVLVCTHIWPIYTPMSPPTPTYVPSYLPMFPPVSHLCPLLCLHKSSLLSLLSILCLHLCPYMCSMCSCGHPMFQLCIFYVIYILHVSLCPLLCLLYSHVSLLCASPPQPFTMQ